MQRTEFIAAVLAVAIATGTLSSADARDGPGSADSGAPPFVDAQATVAQAIAAAERHVGGRAIGTGTENVEGVPVFYVDVLRYGWRLRVVVDLHSGRVVEDAKADGRDT